MCECADFTLAVFALVLEIILPRIFESTSKSSINFLSFKYPISIQISNQYFVSSASLEAILSL